MIVILVIVIVVTFHIRTKDVCNDLCSDHDSLEDRGNGSVHHVASRLLELGKEILWDLSEFVTTLIDKSQLLHGFVSFHKLGLLTKDQYDRDDEEDKLVTFSPST